MVKTSEMNSVLVTPASLIESLITVEIKLYFAMDKLGKEEIIALNKKRHQLLNEINENFHNWLNGRDIFPNIKEIKDY